MRKSSYQREERVNDPRIDHQDQNEEGGSKPSVFRRQPVSAIVLHCEMW